MTTEALSSDPLDILLKHDHWGTRKMLEICATLTHEQFHRRFDIGPGSLHHTLAHVIGAMRRWADRIAGRPLRPSFDPPVKAASAEFEVKLMTPAELLAHLDDAAADLAKIIADTRAPTGPGLASIIDVTFGQKRYTFTRGAAFVHVLTHGTHHRAQCLNMLKQLGEPDMTAAMLPEIGAADWQAEVETKQLAPFTRRNAAT